MSRTFVIGDIHGGLRALQHLIGQLGLQQDDRLIFLGDYVDGWPESKQVIDYLMELEQTHACLFIRGNHDAWCEDWLGGKPADPFWLRHGGQATADSYQGISPEEKEKHLLFYQRMLPYYEEGKKRLFIHAGFSSMHGPQRESFASSFFWDRTLWEMALSVDDRIPTDSLFYPKRLRLYEEIYIGHTPTTDYNITTPMQRCNVWNVDTGAAFTGSVTALEIQTKQFFQSPVVQELYPGVKGRSK